MRLRRLVVITLVCVAAMAAPAPAPAHADTIAGKDAVGDAGNGKADIVDHWARYDAKALEVHVRMREASTITFQGSRGPTTRPVFPLDLTISVAISTDGDDEPDALVELWRDGSGNVYADTFIDDTDSPCGRHQTRPQPLGSGRTYVIPVDLPCLGSPATIRYDVAAVLQPSFREPESVDVAPEDTLTPPVARAATGEDGYWLLGRDGGIFSFGDAGFHGSTGDLRLNQPVVSLAAVPDGRGYWFVASDGGVFSFGSAQFFGSTGDIRLNQPIVGMAATPSGRGYWLVASDGGIFTFGDAGFFGSTGDIRLNQPIVGMAASPTGRGYWLVARDGGVFTFGDAEFRGGLSPEPSPPAATAIVATPSGEGYWIGRADGRALSFGDARGTGPVYDKSAAPVVGWTSVGGAELRAVGGDGKVYSLLDADDLGDMRNTPLSAPVIAIAATP